MKIVFSTSGDTLDAAMDNRFGRAAKFLLYNLEDSSVTVIDNMQNLNATQGAGIQSAETIAKLGAEAVITGHCGPKAYRALKAAGIKIFNTNAKTVAEALALFKNGELTEAESADVEGHWA